MNNVMWHEGGQSMRMLDPGDLMWVRLRGGALVPRQGVYMGNLTCVINGHRINIRVVDLRRIHSWRKAIRSAWFTPALLIPYARAKGEITPIVELMNNGIEVQRMVLPGMSCGRGVIAWRVDQC